MNIDCYNDTIRSFGGGKRLIRCLFIISKSDPSITFRVSCFRKIKGDIDIRPFNEKFNAEFNVTSIVSHSSGHKWISHGVFIDSEEEYFDDEMKNYHEDFLRVLILNPRIMCRNADIARRFKNRDFRIATIHDDIIRRALDINDRDIEVGGMWYLRRFD